jgi:hypothetical protein
MRLTEFITRWLHPLPLAGEGILRLLKQQLSMFRAYNIQLIRIQFISTTSTKNNSKLSQNVKRMLNKSNVSTLL